MKRRGVSKKGRLYSVHVIEKSLKHHVIEWIATILSVCGAVLNAQLNIWGFYIFMLGNIFWVGFSIKHRHWGLLMTHLMFFVLNIYGVYVWANAPVL